MADDASDAEPQQGALPPEPTTPQDAKPVYLNQGISYDPLISDNPDEGAKSTLSETAYAAASSVLESGPTSYFGQLAAGLGGKKIDSAQANAEYGVTGPSSSYNLSWPAGTQVSENVAKVSQRQMQDKIQNDFVSATRPQTWAGFATQEASSIIASQADPLNIAATLFPPTAGVDIAATALRGGGAAAFADRAVSLSQTLSGSIAGRLTGSAINNASAVALTQPIILAGSMQDQQDYNFSDAAWDVLLGAATGVAFHGAGELAGATRRGLLKAGASGMDDASSAAFHSDFAATDRNQVIPDLQQRLNRAPTEPEIQAEIGNRRADLVQKIGSGEYAPRDSDGAQWSDNPEANQAPTRTLPDSTITADDITDPAGAEKYGEAADKLDAHNEDLANDPSHSLDDSDRAEAQRPVDQFAKTKDALQGFSDCVAREIST